MLVTDLVKTDQYNKHWEDCLSFISEKCRADSLYKNYISLQKTDFISLPAVIIDNKIIAFSGAQVKDEWGPNIARLSSRFWIHPDYRHSLSKFEYSQTPWYNSEYLIQHQLKEVAERKIPHLFISRQGNVRNGFQKFINLVNRFNNTEFQVLEGLWNISNVPQIVAMYSFAGTNFKQYLKEETTITEVGALSVASG